jgi:ribosomal protein S18 acetylase RimI-like enzyme
MSSPLEFTIRKAQEKDFFPILTLWEKLLQMHREIEPCFSVLGDNPSSFGIYLKQQIRSSRACVLVAEVQGSLCGFIIGVLQSCGPQARGSLGHISDLYVDTPYRRRGIGKALVQEVKNWFVHQGVQGITVQVADRNRSARLFWYQMGFRDFTHRLWYDENSN